MPTSPLYFPDFYLPFLCVFVVYRLLKLESQVLNWFYWCRTILLDFFFSFLFALQKIMFYFCNILYVQIIPLAHQIITHLASNLYFNLGAFWFQWTFFIFFFHKLIWFTCFYFYRICWSFVLLFQKIANQNWLFWWNHPY